MRYKLDKSELLRIAEAWIEFHNAADQADEHHKAFWAYEELSRLTRTDPEAAWQLIIMIFRLEANDTIFANLAAGPLEDMLLINGDQFVDRIEKLAIEDASFRKLIGLIWKNKIPDQVWSRLQTLK